VGPFGFLRSPGWRIGGIGLWVAVVVVGVWSKGVLYP